MKNVEFASTLIIVYFFIRSSYILGWFGLLLIAIRSLTPSESGFV